MFILYLIYDILFIIGFLLYLPLGFLRKKINFFSLREKLGFIPFKEEKSIWIQAVSVGEVLLLGNFIEKLREKFNSTIILSTTTLTGRKVAEKMYKGKVKIFFFPLDISFIIKKVLKKINPKIFIAVETEIWPNLFFRLKKNNISVIIINGRISQNAFIRYKKVKFFIKEVLSYCRYLGVQDKSYRDKFLALGAEEEKTIITGNMKFDAVKVAKSDLERVLLPYQDFLRDFKNTTKTLIVAGSTHWPEEVVIIKALKFALNYFSGISLIIAPRHPHKVPLIEKEIKENSFLPVRLSKIKRKETTPYGARIIYLLDTVGELLAFYWLADICFVGGSLFPFGGHNILEPLYFSKPVIFGPFMDNFSDIERIVLEHSAAIKADKENFSEVLFRLIGDRSLREKLSQRATFIFQEERRSLENNFNLLIKAL